MSDMNLYTIYEFPQIQIQFEKKNLWTNRRANK